MKYVLTLVYAFILFCFMIIIHEFGHFISARILGVKVHEFSMGMGPALWKRQKGDTLYAVRLLPIGGYCALEGEDEVSEDTDLNNPSSFLNQPMRNKFLILCAGSVMNILLCIILLIIVYTSLSKSIITGIQYGFAVTGYIIKMIFESFRMLFSGAASTDDLMGIVGIAEVVSEQAKMGLIDVTYLMGMLSANLAVVNMMPFPALDGGRIFLMFLKKLSGGRISDRAESIIHIIGLVLLMLLMLFLVVKDTIRIL